MIYTLNNGLEVAEAKIREMMGADVTIIEVIGGSASGKTSAVAKKLKEAFGDDAEILSMDDYYRGKKFMESQLRKGIHITWDQPEATDRNMLTKHIKELKTGKNIMKPIYSFFTSEREGFEEFRVKKIIILEGLFHIGGDFTIFVDIGLHGRILRRLLRDVKRTVQTPADILEYFSEVVQPMHEKYIEGTKAIANMIILNEYIPQIEAKRSGLHEIQLKFQTKIEPDTLRKLGAEPIGKTLQFDSYYNPKDRDLAKTGEIVRIRYENDSSLLTYKGPRISSEFRERPKFEFEINEEVRSKFLAIYGDQVKDIVKYRSFYIIDGIIMTIDKVSKVVDENLISLGKFIEIRSTNKGMDEENLKAVIAKLGLDFSKGIKKAYVEM